MERKSIHHRGHGEHRGRKEKKRPKEKKAEVFDRKSPPFAKRREGWGTLKSWCGVALEGNPRPRYKTGTWGTRRKKVASGEWREKDERHNTEITEEEHREHREEADSR